MTITIVERKHRIQESSNISPKFEKSFPMDVVIRAWNAKVHFPQGRLLENWVDINWKSVSCSTPFSVLVKGARKLRSRVWLLAFALQMGTWRPDGSVAKTCTLGLAGEITRNKTTFHTCANTPVLPYQLYVDTLSSVGFQPVRWFW